MDVYLYYAGRLVVQLNPKASAWSWKPLLRKISCLEKVFLNDGLRFCQSLHVWNHHLGRKTFSGALGKDIDSHLPWSLRISLRHPQSSRSLQSTSVFWLRAKRRGLFCSVFLTFCPSSLANRAVHTGSCNQSDAFSNSSCADSVQASSIRLLTCLLADRTFKRKDFWTFSVWNYSDDHVMRVQVSGRLLICSVMTETTTLQHGAP